MDWLLEQLPPIETIKLRSEPDYYGIGHLIAAQLGKATPPRSFADWMHGAGPCLQDNFIHPRELTCWGNPNDFILVANSEQVKILNTFGYQHVEAVGLPFVYADTVTVPRRPSSLLVMPPHSTDYTEHQWNQEHYAAQIAELKPYFSEIVVSIYGNCVKRGDWIPVFEHHNIPWITGASINDKNALFRMHSIFNSFEYMTTNTVGSHIAYAAYAGCKISIYGTYAEPKVESFKRDPWYCQYPELLKKYLHFSQEKNLRERFPTFFTTPMESKSQQEWAAQKMGKENQRMPAEIAELLGWSFQRQFVGYSKKVIKKLSLK